MLPHWSSATPQVYPWSLGVVSQSLGLTFRTAMPSAMYRSPRANVTPQFEASASVVALPWRGSAMAATVRAALKLPARGAATAELAPPASAAVDASPTTMIAGMARLNLLVRAIPMTSPVRRSLQRRL
jgi:hypothetical protein